MSAGEDYRKLSIADKRRLDLSRARDAAIRCPDCDMQVIPADLLPHLAERCMGKPEPGPGAKWVNARDARALGVPKSTLIDWAARGLVRTRGAPIDREYLLGDLVKLLSSKGRVPRRSTGKPVGGQP